MDGTMQNNVDCRLTVQADLPQVKQLWQRCFDDTPEFVDWFFERYWKAEHTIGIFDLQNQLYHTADILQASAQIIPYHIRVRETDLSSGYIVGVDTVPEARNKGYAKRMLQECLRMQRERGQAISLLMPFEGQFYYRYGWSFCYFHQRIVVAPKELRCAAAPWGTVRKVDLFEAQPELERIYHKFTQQYHGTVNRTADQWRLQLEDAQLEHTVCFLIENEMQQAQGYFLWEQQQEQGFIREMAWCHARAKAGMLYYLMQNTTDGETLWLELSEDDSIKYQLAATKTDIVLYPFLMARIVDVQQCLEAIRYSIQDTELLLTVQDEFAQWNAGTYYVRIQNGVANVDLVTEEERMQLLQCSAVSVTCTIEGLSQLVMGARSADALMRDGLLCCSDAVQPELISLLQRIWPLKNNYINEYY